MYDREFPPTTRDHFDELPPAAFPHWQGPEIALAKIEEDLEIILKSLFPYRPDIITHLGESALRTVHQLQAFWPGPPGYAMEGHEHEREEREREERREREYERRR